MTQDVEQAVRQADALQRANRLGEALAVLEGVLAAAPDHALALGMLGTVRLRRGETGAGERALERACALAPGLVEASYNLATLRLQQGAFAAALERLEAVVEASPRFAFAHVNRGVALLGLERAEEAVDAFRAALAIEPGLVAAHRSLAAALSVQGRGAQAVAALERAAALSPEDPGLREELAHAGLAAAQQAEADGRAEEAEALYEAAATDPGARGEALTALSNLLERRGAFAEARDAGREAAWLRPDLAAAHNNLGVACLRLGLNDEAEAAYRAALSRAPAYAEAHHGLSFALLKQQRFAEAWPEYEWRTALPAARAALDRMPTPRWRGEPLPQGSVLLIAEQGFGDMIQAARFAALIRPRVREVVLQAPRNLVGLLRSLPSIDRVVADDLPLPRHDAWLPLMSLFGVVGVTPAFRPGALERPAPRGRRVEAWAERLPPGRLRVGVAWQGNPEVRVEHGRSFPLAALAPLAEAGATLVSLQKGFGVEQVEAAPFPIHDLGPAYRDGDFEETAAVIRNLDLVVCCDTSVGHVAGAIGAPAWIALGANPDWRWLARREDSLWYDHVRLFRRLGKEPWAALFERMGEQLRARFGEG